VINGRRWLIDYYWMEIRRLTNTSTGEDAVAIHGAKTQFNSRRRRKC
jgi:hypothetical protein